MIEAESCVVDSLRSELAYYRAFYCQHFQEHCNVQGSDSPQELHTLHSLSLQLFLSKQREADREDELHEVHRDYRHRLAFLEAALHASRSESGKLQRDVVYVRNANHVLSGEVLSLARVVDCAHDVKLSVLGLAEQMARSRIEQEAVRYLVLRAIHHDQQPQSTTERANSPRFVVCPTKKYTPLPDVAQMIFSQFCTLTKIELECVEGNQPATTLIFDAILSCVMGQVSRLLNAVGPRLSRGQYLLAASCGTVDKTPEQIERESTSLTQRDESILCNSLRAASGGVLPSSFRTSPVTMVSRGVQTLEAPSMLFGGIT